MRATPKPATRRQLSRLAANHHQALADVIEHSRQTRELLADYAVEKDALKRHVDLLDARSLSLRDDLAGTDCTADAAYDGFHAFLTRGLLGRLRWLLTGK